MSSKYVEQCSRRAFQSIDKLKKEGKYPIALEISSDVWTLINMGGINIFPREKIFAGLKVIEREDLTNYIQAVCN